jgi:ferredoxin, 2Fe-2S
MLQLIVTVRSGEECHVTGKLGDTLMETLRAADVGDIQALCGGCCSCATCHVYVDPALLDVLPAMGQDERDLLDGVEFRRPNSRLSCQLRLAPELEGLRVTVGTGELKALLGAGLARASERGWCGRCMRGAVRSAQAQIRAPHSAIRSSLSTRTSTKHCTLAQTPFANASSLSSALRENPYRQRAVAHC